MKASGQLRPAAIVGPHCGSAPSTKSFSVLKYPFAPSQALISWSGASTCVCIPNEPIASARVLFFAAAVMTSVPPSAAVICTSLRPAESRERRSVRM